MGNPVVPYGIPSYCTANELALEGVLLQALRLDGPVLIEATSNQVNQLGGYTGMKPEDYREYVFGIADRTGFPRERLILAGDHLGPQPFKHLPEAEAMPLACEMVRQYAAAGYTKLHLDTSMRLGDDDPSAPLPDRTVARRGAELLKVAEQAWNELKAANPAAVHPVYIIGSEVPIPGGAQEKEDMQITDPEAFAATVQAYKEVFSEYGLSEYWRYVIAVVVQPGVEFGDADVHMYRREDAAALCARLKDFPELMFEGHSTDYQSPQALRQMVQDGVGILKVGPALTFAAREALFALNRMEEELIDDPGQRSDYIATVERVMTENPKDWKKYYHGTPKEQALKRAYSYSDRSRYYMPDSRIEASMHKLFANLASVDIPMGMLHQYMPLQYIEVRDGRLRLEPRALVLDAVRVVCDDYNYATRS